MFYREGRVNPFLSLGVARITTILKPGESTNRDLAALYGVGLLIDVGGTRDDGSAMQLRADLGARRVFNSGDNPVQDPIDYVGRHRVPVFLGRHRARRMVEHSTATASPTISTSARAHRPARRWMPTVARCRWMTMATA